MKKEQRSEFVEFLLKQADYYGAKLSTDVVGMWTMDLEPFELEAIKKSFHEHRRSSKFFPKISEILAILTPEPRSPLIAWAEVEKAMFEVGSYETVQFTDSVTNAVILDMGGWPWFCIQDLDEPWTQKEFERRYREYREHGISSNLPLIGNFSTQNRITGNALPKPILIGDGPTQLQPPDRSEEVLAKLQKMMENGNREGTP